MVETIINWVFSLITEFAKFGTWLVEPLPYIDISPLALFSFSGLTILLGFLLVRLVIGG